MHDDDESNVVSIHTRAPYEAPVLGPVEDAHVDTRSVETLEQILQMAEDGELVGVCVLAFDAKTKVPVTFAQFIPGEVTEAAATRALGALEVLKTHLTDMAVYGDDMNVDEEWDGYDG